MAPAEPAAEQVDTGAGSGSDSASDPGTPTEDEEEEEETTEDEAVEEPNTDTGSGSETPSTDDGSDAGGSQGNASGGGGDAETPDAGDDDTVDEPEQPAPDSTDQAPESSDDDVADGEQPAPTTDTSSQEWSDAGVSNFQILSQSSSQQTNVPVTVGQVFPQGAVQSAQSLQASADGSQVPLQVDPKASWPDGSLRHAVVTVRLPELGAGESPLVVLESGGAGAAAGAISVDQLLATSFDAKIDISLGGRSYTASARQLLEQASAGGNCSEWGRQCKQWLSGPLVSEWLVGGPVTASGEDQSNVATYFHIRAYADGSGNVARVRVDTVVENNWAYRAAPRNVDYDATISTGDSNYNVSGLTHYDHARWHKVLWWQGAPDAYAQVNVEQLQNSRAVSRYADVTPSDALLSDQRTVFKPMEKGDQTQNMGTTGAQQSIGPLPRWTSSYVVSSDPRAFEWMRINDDSAGSYSFHYRDAETGRPLEIARHPYVTIAAHDFAKRASGAWQDDLLPSCNGNSDSGPEQCDTPLDFDISHHPSIGYVSYIVTGDYYYLEETQFTASYVELWLNAQYRDFEKGHLGGQVRGQAWSLRSIADAAFITPDDDPLKGYYEGLVDNNISKYNESLTESGNPIHAITDGGAAVYRMNGQDRVGIAPWQQDFFTWAVGHAAEQGFAEADRLLEWLAAFQIGRMTNWKSAQDGYCWLQASTYKLQVRGTSGGADYASLDRAYQETLPELQGLECNSQEMANLWEGGRYQRGEMAGYAGSPTGFPANFQIALAMAADSGLPDADQAWQIFEGRSVRPNYSDYPNFALEPRE